MRFESDHKYPLTIQFPSRYLTDGTLLGKYTVIGTGTYLIDPDGERVWKRVAQDNIYSTFAVMDVLAIPAMGGSQ